MGKLSGIYLRPKDCRFMSVYALETDFFEMSISDADGEEATFVIDTTRLLDWLKEGAWEKIDEEAV